MQYTTLAIPSATPHSCSSPSSTVTLLRAVLCPSELLPATPELDPSPSVLSPKLPKLQLDSRLLGSAGFGDELEPCCWVLPVPAVVFTAGA